MKKITDPTISPGRAALQKQLKSKTSAVERLTRQLEIEASLESVRAGAMAMQKSEELAQAANLLFHQMQALDIPAFSAGYCIWADDKKAATFWMSSEGVLQPPFKVPLTENAMFIHYREAHQRGEAFYAEEFGGEELVKHYQYMGTIPDIIEMMDLAKDGGIEIPAFPTFQVNHVVYFSHGFLLFVTYKPVPEAHDIFKRFGKVFDQTYTRFLDLQKAEAQAREAQIEAALERVRSRSLAMHKSDELEEVAAVVLAKIQELNITNDGEVSIVTLKEDSKDFTVWLASPEHNLSIYKFNVPYADFAVFNAFFDAKAEGLNFLAKLFSFKEKNEFFQYLHEHTDFKYLPEDRKKYIEERESYSWSAAWGEKSGIQIPSHTGKLLSEKEGEILKRFATVFEQSYIRFLDLQRAEAQAREAQIEAALERVRSRSLAMHKSNELQSVVNTVYEGLIELDIKMDSANFMISQADSRDSDLWIAAPDQTYSTRVHLPYFDIYPFKDLMDAWENQSDFFEGKCTFEEKNKWFNYAFEHTDLRYAPDNRKMFILEGKLWTFSMALAKHSAIQLNSYSRESFSETENEILKRFTKVFEQAYIRFLDLQKAEAQAREAQIEAALEKVRSRSMAMHRTDELQEVVRVVAEALKDLDIILDVWGAVICTYFKDSKDVVHWTASEDPKHPSVPYLLPYFEDELFDTAWNSKNSGDDYFAKDFSFDVKNAFFKHAFEHSDYRQLPEEYKKAILETRSHGIAWAWSENSAIMIPSMQGDLPSEHDKNILIRFAKVFEQAYIRFLDLQKAEDLARKAKIETAMERVRARALAMQAPEELKNVAQVLREQMGNLGVEELETCSIYIHTDNTETAECWYALKDIRKKKKKLVSDHFALDLKDTWVGRKMLQFYHSSRKKASIVMKGSNRKEWIHYCEEKSGPLRGYYGEVIPERTYHLYKFSNGAIGFASLAEISDESWDLLKRAASVFSLAYSRFKDLTRARIDLLRLKEEKEKAEDALMNLKAAQTQLIHSEKMASLGELTAGIAHEIQNPLNFVNNFSEVSVDLIEELKAETRLPDGQGSKPQTDIDEKMVEEILNDVIGNLEKIHHHGKRASSIVKGMLEHSRTSNKQKELTDINVLADEYLRLAYHGLRAKDKSFNADFVTDLDENLPKINVIGQDIGRVLLNLINNAFFAVSSKSETKAKGYIPKVTVKTKHVENHVEISVKDNADGIPAHILDKIFQPFFTTKPTGQGTGLGLSLSYDIITKGHNGNLEVDTTEGVGSEFIITLPI